MGERKIVRGVETKYYVPTPQKGRQIKLPNYSGMLLLCTAYRTCTTILKNKLQSYIEKRHQAGFTQGHQQSIRFPQRNKYYRIVGNTT